jgi:hypothetical protein
MGNTVLVKPQGEVLKVFTATSDFFCEETGTNYAKGATYYLRQGNNALAKRMKRWLLDRRIEILNVDVSVYN